MAVELEALVGSDNMTPDKQQQVITIVRGLNQPAEVKKLVYARWLRLVGLPVSAEALTDVTPR